MKQSARGAARSVWRARRYRFIGANVMCGPIAEHIKATTGSETRKAELLRNMSF